ncbi:MAG: hypothetical protein Q4D04_03800 [Clostridia bacterium]|nr:hypothetical protein [Clostridia bacterium]
MIDLFFAAIISGLGWAYIAAFVLTLGCFTAFVMGDKPSFRNTPLSYEGLWQRLKLLTLSGSDANSVVRIHSYGAVKAMDKARAAQKESSSCHR